MRRAYRRRSRRVDRALVAITRAASYARLWLVIAAGLAAVGGRPARRAALQGVTALALASAVSNGPAKLLVRRARPTSRLRPALIRMPRSTSFPSGHSASAFAFTTATCGELPGLTPLLAPLACAVAYSRVYTGVHYPSDVAAGAAIGLACGVIARRLTRHLAQLPRR